MWDSGGQVVLDAHTGRIIAVVPDAMTIAPIQVLSAAKETDAVDPQTGQPMLWMINWSALEKVVKDGVATEAATETAKRAATNAEKVLEFYMKNFGRDSFDNKGADSTSAVHIGKGFSNAFWLSSAKVMGYGDGDGKRFGDFTRSLDVAGHEMTHGVISQTAKLQYWAESGALNESLADFFGEMIEGSDDWVLGKDLYLNPAEGKNGIRNIRNPGVRTVVIDYDKNGNPVTKPYPSKASEMFPVEEDEDLCDSSNDNCWVHVNSLVPTRAAYFMTRLIGKDATARNLYSTLEYNLLTELSNFKHFKEVTMKACEMIYDPLFCTRGVLPAFEQVEL
jgi:Zn-dependent metalloprotease